MEPGCAPERVGQAHVPDQPTDLQRHPRSSVSRRAASISKAKTIQSRHVVNKPPI
jgi:hypothetical protein